MMIMMTELPVSAYMLFSGSSGNSLLISAYGDSILIDAGRSCGAIKKACRDVGVGTDTLRAVFITHEHHDHVSALDVMSRRLRLPVHITYDSLGAMKEKDACGEKDVVVPHPIVYTERVGKMTVTSFPTHHDSAASVGYIVDIEEAGVRIGLCTDTGYVDGDMLSLLSACTHVVLESNHDVEMLTHGPYPFYLKERILSGRGHLSNKDAAAAACSMLECGVRSFTLAHLSRENNTPQLALAAVRSKLDGVGAAYSLDAAPPYEPLRVV